MFLAKIFNTRPRLSETSKSVLTVAIIAILMLVSAILAARADDCAGQCRAQHNQCRLQNKGSPSCDAQQAACNQRCIAQMTKKAGKK